MIALHVCKASRAPLVALASVNAVADLGLEGDRRRTGRRQVLVAEQETLDEFGLAPGAIREQVTVRGLGLDRLAAGTRLRVGNAVLEVGSPCSPCERMNELRPGLRRQLEGRRGRFVRVVQAGSFAVGDTLHVEPPG